MTDINFTSTYRIPITQAGINSAKKARLKELIKSYPNGLIGSSKVGNARVSISDKEDANFIGKLKKIGYKVYQKFEGENIPKEELDIFIKEKLDTRNYNQKGKNPERLSRKQKEQKRCDRRFNPIEKPITEEIDPVLQEKIKHAQQTTIGVCGDLPFSEEEKYFIRRSPSYIELCKQENPEFAEAVFFGIQK